ncbi:MAG: hypothetical protein J5873_02635 [Bacteroidales bacterium]|nr:hypothetical protein [Bacteroidales bacterium]
MKKTLTMLMLTVGAASFLFAQKSAVNSAYTHYGNQYWDKAKRSIDAACLHPDTKDDAKTWMYKGNIYLMIANNTNPKYSNLCVDPLDTAYAAYYKAFQLNQDIRVAMQIATPSTGLKYCSDLFYNQAIAAINAKDYEQAFQKGEKSFKCNPENRDAEYLYALTAELSGKKDIAKQHYGKLVKANIKKNEPYMHLSLLYKEENDTARALAVIKRHSVLKDTSSQINIDYATTEAIVYAWAGDIEKSMAIMDKALAQDPNNYTLLVNMGTELTSQKNYVKAEELLQKANALKPDDYMILYNLGTCYYNCYVDLAKAMGSISDDAEYAKAEDSTQVLLRKALPYLEKALSVEGNDRNTLLMLSFIYPRIEKKDGDPDFMAKLKEVSAKLEELK